MDQAVGRYLSDRYGLRPRETWGQLIQRAVAEHGSPSGVSSAAVERWLVARPTLMVSLLGRLVVSESFFFRHEEQLKILAERLTTQLEQNPCERLNVWSAGCARGEEVYSLALVLANVFGRTAVGRVQLWGTDVSEEAISRARTGRFSAWSWRRRAQRNEHIHFDDDGDFTVASWLRDWVKFDVGLVRERADTLPANHVDAILFRNVAIYLTEASLTATYRSLHRVLRPGGLLFVAPTDPPPQDFIAMDHPAWPTPIYRKPEPAQSAPDFGRAPSVGAPPPPSPDPEPERLTPSHSLARAMLSLADSDYDGAASMLCRAALLFPEHTLLRYWSAYALVRKGHVRRAELQLNALRDLLSARDAQDILEDAETTTEELRTAAERLQKDLA